MLLSIVIYYVIKVNSTKNVLDDLQQQYSQLILERQEIATRLELSSQLNIELKNDLIISNDKNDVLLKEKLHLDGKNNALEDKLIFQQNELKKMHENTTLQFENIAQKLLEEKSSKFTQVNQLNIEAILKPLNENIHQFKKQVEDTYDKESKIRFSLDERIKELMNQTTKISTEANNLANALKNNHKKQGDWGEMILESILQKSGLIKDREYRVQNNLVTNEGKNLRPDIIVDLPNNRSIIIDSKVSLNAYEQFCSVENTDEQKIHLASHLKAIRFHIDDLSTKDYHKQVNGLDFTMLFVPIEPAYLLAMQNDTNLWNDAYKKRILLISPTNLIACLKLIVDLWNRDKQDKSAEKIVKQAERMYDKMVLFSKTFDQVGKQIEQLQDNYNKAQNQLKEGKGNVLNQTNQLLKFGISPKNILPTED